MSTYLTRSRIALSSTAKDPQSKNTISGSKTVSKAKRVIEKDSKIKDNRRIISTRSITSSANLRNRKNDSANLYVKHSAQNEKQRTTRNKKFSTEKVNNEPKPSKVVTRSGSSKQGQEVKDVKKKSSRRVNKNVSRARQMSLRESFLKQSKIRLLHSHNDSKNVKSDSTPIKEKNKQPIYECLPPENAGKSPQNNSEIYEFKFDVNDSRERIPKKRKKKATAKNTLTSKKKNFSEKYNLPQARVYVKKLHSDKSKDTKEAHLQEAEFKEITNSVKPLIKDKKNALKKNVKKDMEVKTEQQQLENFKAEESLHKSIKPSIISVDCVKDRVRILSTPKMPYSDDFRPFRATNIFNNRQTSQQKNALNNSLFDKSLSPIIKTSENPQINSPSRDSPLLTFSQVKSLYQSTPQNKKYNISSNKVVRTFNNESRQYGTPTEVKNNHQENIENISAEKHAIANMPKLKGSTSSRKFGTEITNTDHSFQSSVVEQFNERISDIENAQPSGQSSGTVTASVNNIIKFNSKENKTQANILSPNKDIKKNTMEVKLQNHKDNILRSPLTNNQRENYDPQPGPSGIQNRLSSNEEKVLKQSNLNNFLNIMDIPQSTTIKTPHGIFDDANSVPVSGKPVKNFHHSNMDISNAFGFSDDSNENTSAVEPKTAHINEERVLKPIVGTQNIRKAARLSIGEIKNKLLTKQSKDCKHNKENIIQTSNIEKIKSSPKKKNKLQINVTNFSDTFDILSEPGDTSVTSMSEIPLFTDHEPSHFSQPPQRSYKRKRAVRFSFSGGESDKEEEELQFETKRKKGEKLKKEQENRLMEWVKDINRTFSEIDEHELVIE